MSNEHCKIDSITARSPAKIILSGEHAVVYGKPALAAAIDLNMQTTLALNNDVAKANPPINFYLKNLNSNHSIDLRKLYELKQRVSVKYYQYLCSERKVLQVLDNPSELIQYAFISILDKFNVRLYQGMTVYTESTIPIGCGLGSSAATIISTIHAMNAYFQLDITLDQYLIWGQNIENLQHGKSSGLDVYLSIHGGCVKFINHKPIPVMLPNFPMYLVNTGRPETTTGECVTYTAKYLQNNAILNEFEVVTNDFVMAIELNNFVRMQECVRANHRLLSNIYVVPEKVKRFILDLEKIGAAAKICGAGACAGDNAGVVLVLHTENIAPIAQKYGYEILSTKLSSQGVQVVPR